jgi:hypothetical protein
MKYLIILLYLCSFSVFSQEIEKESIFLNEKSEIISKSLFKRKCNSAIFDCKTYLNGDIIENILSYKFHFGKISLDEVKTIYTYFKSLSKKNIIPNKNLLFHHSKTLLGYKEMLKIRSAAFKRTLDNPENRRVFINEKNKKPNIQEYTNKIYLSRLNFSRKKHSKYIKNVERNYNTSVINIYHKNKGQPIKNKYFTWIQDSTNTFLNKNHVNIMILKPNGEYFIKYNSHFNKENIYKLLSEEDWSIFFNDWKKSIENNSIKGIGIIGVLTKT